MSCKILISTTVGWTSTARHAAGFAQAGCRVEAVAPSNAPVRASRYVSACHPYRSISGPTSLRNAIRRAEPDLIVSCDDRAIANLLRLYDAEPAGSPMTEAIARSLGAPDRYPHIISREASMRAARALGIRAPETLPVPHEAALAGCLKMLGFPAVLKADGSWGGEGVAIVETPEEARAAFRRLAQAPSRLRSILRAAKRRDGHWLLAALSPHPRAISIQKFVHGKPAASGFAAWNGEIVGAVYYDMLKTDGAMGPPSVIRRVDCPEIAEATRRMARHFKLSGLHGLDFIRDEAGHVHLLEINPRATQGGTLPFGPGRDLAAALASCIAPGAKHRTAIDNDLIVFFPHEWLQNPSSAYLRAGYHDVPWDDPPILRAGLPDRQWAPPVPALAHTDEGAQRGFAEPAAARR